MTETTTPTTTDQLIDAYFDLWRATEPADRERLVARVFTPDGRHVDPNADAQGHAEVAAMMAAAGEIFAGHTMDRTSGIDQHGDQLRFAWRVDAPDGTTVLTGIDVAELAPDGRLARVAGFWGELPVE